MKGLIFRLLSDWLAVVILNRFVLCQCRFYQVLDCFWIFRKNLSAFVRRFVLVLLWIHVIFASLNEKFSLFFNFHDIEFSWF